MSKSIDIATSMVDRLNASALLQGVEAMVSRQKDLTNEINQRALKIGGAAVIVQFEGFRNPDRNAAVNPTVARRYSVTIYTRPLMREGETPADDVVEYVARSLHNWDIPEATSGAAEITVDDCDIVPDKSFLIHQLSITCLSRL